MFLCASTPILIVLLKQDNCIVGLDVCIIWFLLGLGRNTCGMLVQVSIQKVDTLEGKSHVVTILWRNHKF